MGLTDGKVDGFVDGAALSPTAAKRCVTGNTKMDKGVKVKILDFW